MESETQTLRDDEREWHVVVLGSGLQETFLAWQLSASGKTVLQLDSHPFYGGSQAALSIPELERLAQAPSRIFRNFQIHTSETCPPSRPRAYNLALAPYLIYPMTGFYGVVDTERRGQQYSWAAVDGFFTFVPEGGDGVVGGGLKEVVATAAVKARRWNKKRKGGSVASVSSVASMETPNEEEKPAASEPKPVTPFKRVPCSEEDIAFAPTLSDHSRASMGLFMRDILSPTHSSSTTPLATHLSTTSLSPALTSQICTLLLTHLPPASIPVSLAHAQLNDHAKSLGVITNVKSAAALTLGFGGFGELCQDWARLVAVNGGLNILERSVVGYERKGEGIEVELSSGEMVRTSWLVGARYMFPGESGVGGRTLFRGIYVVRNPMRRLFEHKEASDDSIPASAVLYFPAGSLERNLEPVYVLARDEGTADCPRGEAVLYISSFSGTDALKKAFTKVLESWADAGSTEVVWSAEFEQTVGTESEEDGNVIKIGELDGDLVLRQSSLDRLQAWKTRILGEEEVTEENDTMDSREA